MCVAGAGCSVAVFLRLRNCCAGGTDGKCAEVDCHCLLQRMVSSHTLSGEALYKNPIVITAFSVAICGELYQTDVRVFFGF